MQAKIVDLIRNLHREHNVAHLFISHELKVVRAIAHELIVVKDDRIVERESAKEVFDDPQTDYTKAFLAAAFDLEALSGVASS